MSRIGRQIGHELSITEAEMEELNASLERNAKRAALAVDIAKETYGSDDIEVGRAYGRPDDEEEWVDGGYWVNARVWVDADAVEERME